MYAQQKISKDFNHEINHSNGSAKKRFLTLQKLLDEQANMSEFEKLDRVNRFFNLFQFVSDMQFKGEPDYWQTPKEFIESAAGDCEDFSIAKYFTLLKMGVPSERLKIVYVKSKTLNQAHMVLAYYESTGSDPLILDNINSKILPASERSDLIPVYSFNIDGLWLVRQQSRDQRVGDSNRLRKWQDLLKRMEKEGTNNEFN
jgi:predicted transglutaminase-like cysteine proteinase